jgi:mannose-6-phosphate isomerase-like protein (cupin superfamily)
MRKLIYLAAAAVATVWIAAAADPAGFNLWKSDDLKKMEKALAPKINAMKVGTQPMANYGNHFTMIAHREGNGEAELHEKVADLFVVQAGEATLVVGGTMPAAKTTAPGEKRAPSIEGGSKHKLTAGDVVHIPANTPHQLLIENGKQFDYFTMKVESK